MSRFKKGDTVYMGRGEHLREMIIARVIDNPMLPVYQYSFEAPHDGFACGEQSIRSEIDGPDLSISQCYKQTEEEIKADTATRINTIASGKKQSILSDELGLLDVASVFFKPDLNFCEWLKDYANGRLIVDIGAGQGHLVRMLKMVGAKVMGIEPNLDYTLWLKLRADKDLLRDPNEMLPGTAKDHRKLLYNLGNKALIVFARPCHSNFVEDTIYHLDDGTESLYITLPENIHEYNDLGVFKEKATLINHNGVSEDNEVVYSIIR